MRKTISILFLTLYSFVLCQDVYPYFSDPKKEGEFGERFIYIVEEDESRQIITGGGSEYDFLASYLAKHPVYKPKPIKTHYQNRKTFDIVVPELGGNISRVELLKYIGQTEKYNNIINDYNNRLDSYNSLKRELLGKDYYGSKYRRNLPDGLKYDSGIVDGIYNLSILSLIIGSIGYFWTGYNAGVGLEHEDYDDYNSSVKLHNTFIDINTVAVTVALISYFTPHKLKVKYIKSPPSISTGLTNAQIRLLSDSFNRRLYKEIQSK